MAITEISIIHHVAMVLLLLWLLNVYSCCHPILYFASLIYLYQVHERYIMRMSRKFQFQERKQANQRRVLLDSESVRWLNHAVEKMWPLCMEDIVSQKILLPIIPWFLEKYKPWTVRKAEVQHLYLGRNPPMFTEMRVFREPTDDDHLVLELGLNFLTADDMSAILAAKLRRRLGFGMSTKLHLTSMHVEGKVLVGVKFLRKWPFIARLRVCFAEPPYFQMNVKPLFSHGLDVTELPGIAGWLDNLLAVAFEQTLVEPNMLVVDLEKFVSPKPENWFSVDVKEPVAFARVEVIEGSDMKPSDPNGLADPYVKGQLGPYRFKTKIHKKTLNPKWQEEYKIPICAWDSKTVLDIEVRDKDRIIDDSLGACSINITDLRDGQRHDMWVPLENIKIGRLHLAITVVEPNGKVMNHTGEDENANSDDEKLNLERVGTHENGLAWCELKTNQKVTDMFEPIDIQGQDETGIWVHHPGKEISQTWEPRKGKKSRQHVDTYILREDGGENSIQTPRSSSRGTPTDETSSSNDNSEGNKSRFHRLKLVRRGLQKINSAFHRSSPPSARGEDSFNSSVDPIPSPYANVKSVDANRIGVRFVVEDSLCEPLYDRLAKEDGEGDSSNEGSGPEVSTRAQVKGVAKNIIKQAGKSAKTIKHVLSRKASKHFSRSSGVEGGQEGSFKGVESESSIDDLSSSVYDLSVEGTSIILGQHMINDGNDSSQPQFHVVHTDSASPRTESPRQEPQDQVVHTVVASPSTEPLRQEPQDHLVHTVAARVPNESLKVEHHTDNSENSTEIVTEKVLPLEQSKQ